MKGVKSTQVRTLKNEFWSTSRISATNCKKISDTSNDTIFALVFSYVTTGSVLLGYFENSTHKNVANLSQNWFLLSEIVKVESE